MQRMINRILTLALTCIPISVWALASDTEQPILIEADSLDADDAKGITTYRGSVRYTQGSIVLTSDTLTAHTVKGELKKIEAEGNPVRFKQQPEGKDQEVRGQAKKMQYFADTEILQLQGSAHLWQGADEFLGSRIDYDTQRENVKASRAESGEGRVQVIIAPRKKDNSKATAPPPAPP